MSFDLKLNWFYQYKIIWSKMAIVKSYLVLTLTLSNLSLDNYIKNICKKVYIIWRQLPDLYHLWNLRKI